MFYESRTFFRFLVHSMCLPYKKLLIYSHLFRFKPLHFIFNLFRFKLHQFHYNLLRFIQFDSFNFFHSFNLIHLISSIHSISSILSSYLDILIGFSSFSSSYHPLPSYSFSPNSSNLSQIPPHLLSRFISFYSADSFFSQPYSIFSSHEGSSRNSCHHRPG